ncbi:rhodanese-like domain-containing protein [Thiohalorhabdus sp. Cl-TMA]|uniref:Rhodanese-like domain-containing protein n=1 Tax=Thiohalorhabdus methylotrophus TaxID=3242694 RepID=A0ABV4TVS8_9GAMM
MIEFLQENWLLVAGLGVMAVLLLKGPLTLRLGGVGSVDPAGAVRLINHDNARVVDVREDREWQQGHISGAVHAPLGQLSGRMDELEPIKESGAPVVVVCRSGTRSATAAVQLRKAGFPSVYNLSGGTMAWQQSGMPLEK